MNKWNSTSNQANDSTVEDYKHTFKRNNVEINESLLDAPNNLNQNDGNGSDQQTQRLLQVIADALTQGTQLKEQSIVKIPTFAAGIQDPIGWLDLVEQAFEANNIQETRRLAVVGPHLSGLAALWWTEQKNRIKYWDNEFAPRHIRTT